MGWVLFQGTKRGHSPLLISFMMATIASASLGFWFLRSLSPTPIALSEPIPLPDPIQLERPLPRPILDGRDPLLATVPNKVPQPPAAASTHAKAILPTVPPPALQPVPPSQGPAPQVRVAIARDQSQLTVGTAVATAVTNDQQQVMTQLTPSQGVVVTARDGFLLWNGQPLAPSLWIRPSNQLAFVGDKWYRGVVRLIAQGNTVTAVNQVDLEQYLVSVVGSEVYPDWPMETLKAQAIAARSYALAQMFQPASRFFDLGNDERWQVYRGIETEWNTTQAAVQATRGIVLTKSGRVMVSMYAATDDIVRDVFGGRGMSQTGAYELGKRGYNYLQILGTYYPGAGLSQLQTQ
ncbi:SpoIID/LytB domain-containing protein [Thermosynechococcus sp. PP45]|uniref:SpoIID/LytB domain-containing protein n=2 Tax=Thermosynechococcus TaxID=146785 RepID=UPI002673DAFF|nr:MULTISPECIES: SpoIID/LytB domain-containing protein [unclassified Thermosynechococcus]MDR7921434.1 SpoIID/LytB domain-containing protein [Thermosynechococcus sp. HY213]WKT81873.1 SpoIID/LytB domain-containing protein [Thermosynechococcus sp. PP45]WNC25485.1 SpoIID/LytB domain-containing protein [Thermosynechococcus sp. PP551]WNC28064.1 SpoIID/LytB domain-containing protein [Thermosynechococcus sp. PP555]